MDSTFGFRHSFVVWASSFVIFSFLSAFAGWAQELEESEEAKLFSPRRQGMEKAFQKGADWLLSQQLPDGAWPDFQGKPDVAFTALAVKVLSEAPKTFENKLQEAKRSVREMRELEGKRLPDEVAALARKVRRATEEYVLGGEKYRKARGKAVAFLVAQVQEQGSILDAKKVPVLANYKTALAVMALTAADRVKHAEVISKALQYLSRTQYSEEYMNTSGEDVHYGGWGYDEQAQKPEADQSNVGFTLEALRDAGLDKENAVWARAVRFLERCQNRTESNDAVAALSAEGLSVGEDGGMFYRPVESKAGTATLRDGRKVFRAYGSMTYEGLKSFIYAGVDRNDPRVQAAHGWIRKNYTLEENPGLGTDAEPHLSKQGLFYYYHTFAKALDAYGENEIATADGVKHDWARELADKLVSLQHPEGSWSNEVSRWWEDFKPLATCYCLMALNICRDRLDEGE